MGKGTLLTWEKHDVACTLLPQFIAISVWFLMILHLLILSYSCNHFSYISNQNLIPIIFSLFWHTLIVLSKQRRLFPSSLPNLPFNKSACTLDKVTKRWQTKWSFSLFFFFTKKNAKEVNPIGYKMEMFVYYPTIVISQDQALNYAETFGSWHVYQAGCLWGRKSVTFFFFHFLLSPKRLEDRVILVNPITFLLI